MVKAARQAGADEVHCLAWEFEMDLRLVLPRAGGERGRADQAHPHPARDHGEEPHEPAAVSGGGGAGSGADGAHREGRKGATEVDIKLTRFLPSLAEVPSKELEAMKERAVQSGFDFIDFWAVDFDWHRASHSITTGRITARARIAR